MKGDPAPGESDPVGTQHKMVHSYKLEADVVSGELYYYTIIHLNLFSIVFTLVGTKGRNFLNLAGSVNRQTVFCPRALRGNWI
jgi:hypothetical protein